MKKYIILSSFPTEKQEKEAINKKQELENDGFSLIHSSSYCLTYEKN